MNDSEGYGTLENLVVGRHDPSGFKDLFDVIIKRWKTYNAIIA